MATQSLTKSLEKISTPTGRSERLWLRGEKRDMQIYRVPIEHLYFNIENGRYADKMIQLRTENPGVDIDPRQDVWKEKICEMLKGVQRRYRCRRH